MVDEFPLVAWPWADYSLLSRTHSGCCLVQSLSERFEILHKAKQRANQTLEKNGGMHTHRNSLRWVRNGFQTRVRNNPVHLCCSGTWPRLCVLRRPTLDVCRVCRRLESRESRHRLCPAAHLNCREMEMRPESESLVTWLKSDHGHTAHTHPSFKGLFIQYEVGAVAGFSRFSLCCYWNCEPELWRWIRQSPCCLLFLMRLINTNSY